MPADTLLIDTQLSDVDESRSSPTLSTPDSLFDEVPPHPVATTECPTSIPGLFYDPSVLLPHDLANLVEASCMSTFFTAPGSNQVMLFSRAESADAALPIFLQRLLRAVEDLLRPILPAVTHRLLFAADWEGDDAGRARQAIINHYQVGEGITPHVDLLSRYGDGIVGVSFGGPCAMAFAPASSTAASSLTHEVFLPPRSVIVLTGDARYTWTHGIPSRTADWVASKDTGVDPERIERTTRVSVTFRWLLPGADIVGGP
ncbi:hypothetical protein PENSPDRAFT_757164 [Peniophora sp. CONT]|nr:hypothetical protein PENSPDRAFT_757164 [Peniophora sp. CONT]